ncbi:MAG: FAD-binding oxidoreductase [Synergistaceae bacterium]|nr:FAD-binding oxidoreductase [Synergistaceae bacterium]
MTAKYDRIIIGAGLYGLYAALLCGRKGQNVLVLERDSSPFSRATYINQARVHMGYHYPRSLSTAMKSAYYFERFCEDFGFCNLTEFTQVYATSSCLSWTNSAEFMKFCRAANIPCEQIMPGKYFQDGMCDGAFITKEYTYDAMILKAWFLEQLAELPSVKIACSHRVEAITRTGRLWNVKADDILAQAPFILNASYASVNDIHNLLGFEPFGIKYELCEIILCHVSDNLRNIGLTVMDGPFFSIMPFGKTGLHSLTSVTFTPHETSYSTVADFPCQKRSDKKCFPGSLFNCNECPAKPASAWPYMSQLARKYMKPEYEFSYVKSLYSMKPILKASEIDDSRPTVIRQYSKDPAFFSVLSGKINTVYDLDEVLDL